MRQTILRPLPPAVYRCITPVEEPSTTSSAIYYSPSGHSGKVAQKPYYRAWPQIDHPKRMACLPGLLRAVYVFDIDVHVEAEEAARRAEEYVSRLESITPEIRQQVQAMIKVHQSLANHAIRVDDLSPSGESSKNPTLDFTDTHNTFLNLATTLIDVTKGDNATQVMLAAFQGVLRNHFNFPGVKNGNFSYVFSIVHEMGHQFAKLSYSGVVQEGLAERLHATLYTLATKESLSQKEIDQLWEEYQQTNEHFVSLAKKFELIEEIYANSFAMGMLPPEVRTKVRENITRSLEAEKGDEVYQAFGEACANYQNFCLPSLAVFDTVCRMLEQHNIDSADLLYTFAKIRKVVWTYTKVIKQEHGKDLDSFDLEDNAQREAAVKINRILKRACIPKDVYWSSINMRDSTFNRAYELLNKGLLTSDRFLQICGSQSIRLIGKLSSHEIKPLILSKGFDQEKKGKLSSSIRIFCESLRQQLSMPCGIVCPLAYQGQACCGKKESLERLYERLPEEDKSNFEKPNCDLIR